MLVRTAKIKSDSHLATIDDMDRTASFTDGLHNVACCICAWGNRDPTSCSLLKVLIEFWWTQAQPVVSVQELNNIKPTAILLDRSPKLTFHAPHFVILELASQRFRERHQLSFLSVTNGSHSMYMSLMLTLLFSSQLMPWTISEYTSTTWKKYFSNLIQD